MSRKESRRERKNQEKKADRSPNRGEISRIYYIVIGVLFVILLGLIIFIFSRNGDDVAVNEEDTPVVVEETPETIEDTTDQNNTTNEEESETESEEEQTGESDANEEEEQEQDETEENAADEEELEEGETEVISEDAPLDPDYATDFNDGSSDRVAIKNAVMQATGLDDNLIEWWIGNNGPGRVRATVSDSSQTEYYDVYLQYGDGNWHVTSYESVDGN